jgi:acyl-CoA reductase-like NAD-dependent aldehyde dehydrogenase
MAVEDAERVTTRGPAARAALRQFEPIWAELNPKERAQLLRLLVERIKVDGQAGKVSFVFRATGIAALAQRAGAA